MDFGEIHFSSGIGESDDEVEIHIDWASFLTEDKQTSLTFPISFIFRFK